VIQRQTQTSDYWSAYSFTPGDAEFLYGFVLEEGKPKTTTELAKALIHHRVEQENASVRRLSSNGTFYQPRKSYDIGETLTFPALKFATGQVVEIRPGNNPDLGAFNVVVVEMTPGTRREFAASYTREHALNDLDPSHFMQSGEVKSEEELFEQFGPHISEALMREFERNGEFIRIGDEWFLRAMMAEVNVGHLNLAEAVLDVANGGPLTAEQILNDLGLPPDVAANVQEASLNAALASDLRFDEISLNQTPAWFLRRLEPNEVREVPTQLVPVKFSSPTTINEDLEHLAVELDDELDYDGSAVDPTERGMTVLTFSHRRAGTLGWTRQLSAVLPQTNKVRIPLRFRDKVTGREMTAWLVRDGRYIWGLADWYKANEIPAGAYVELSRSDAENIILIDYRRHRPKREWVRVAAVRDNRLHLETAQRAVSCDVDELMCVFVDDPRSLDSLRTSNPRDVAQAVREAFPEIAKLSPQGNVHARTLYAVVNVYLRSAPKDVFAALTASGAYVPVGDNYWHLGER
jgi:hypothetical protein